MNGNISAGRLALRSIARWLFMLLVVMSAGAHLNGQSVNLAWNMSADPTGTGSIVWWGTVSGNYTASEDVGTNTGVTISNLVTGVTYYFAATCYDAAGDTSGYSTELPYTVTNGTVFTFSNLTQTYNGAPESVVVTTSPANLPVAVTYNGSASAPVNAGAYTVVAQSAGMGSATNTFIITPAPATVTLSGLAAIYNGSAHAVTATTSPAGLAASTTYNGSSSAPVNIGSYAVVSTINNSNYTGSASGTLVISGAGATVTLGNLAQTYTGNACVATATTTPAGLAVNITYNGSSSAPTNCGNYTVIGSISSTNYTGSATNTLAIAKAAGKVSLSGLNQRYTGSPIAVKSSTTPAGMNVTITYNGSAQPPTKIGSYTVVGTIVNSNYNGSATNTLAISRTKQIALATGTGAAEVTLFALDQIYDGTPKSVGVVTVPSGLAVTLEYSSDGVTWAANATNKGVYTVIATISDTNYTGGTTDNLTLYDPAKALVLTWPANVSNPAISASADLTAWLPLTVNIGPTNQLVVPKQAGDQFFQGPGLQIVNPSR
jgi:hypothetical protein